MNGFLLVYYKMLCRKFYLVKIYFRMHCWCFYDQQIRTHMTTFVSVWIEWIQTRTSLQSNHLWEEKRNDWVIFNQNTFVAKLGIGRLRRMMIELDYVIKDEVLFISISFFIIFLMDWNSNLKSIEAVNSIYKQRWLVVK